MRVDLFDFHLPNACVASRPVLPRDAARLLCINPGTPLHDRHVYELPEILQPGDVMVLNDVRVIPAKLKGMLFSRSGEKEIEAILHRRVHQSCWKAFARPAKKITCGDCIHFARDPHREGTPYVTAHVLEKGDRGEIVLGFDLSGDKLERILKQIGHIPLPPYISSKRSGDERDFSDYQTIYAQEGAAVAVPSAGLHFTRELFTKLDAREIECLYVRLDVGAGTFFPVRAEDTRDHRMYPERGVVSQSVADALNAARKKRRRIIAVGTTTLRLLESAACAEGKFHSWFGDTNLFITPGYRFKTADILMTNFHLPRSTLFMLVSSFCGLDVMKAAYLHAISNNYRFFSYGDACLLFRSLSDG